MKDEHSSHDEDEFVESFDSEEDFDFDEFDLEDEEFEDFESEEEEPLPPVATPSKKSVDTPKTNEPEKAAPLPPKEQTVDIAPQAISLSSPQEIPLTISVEIGVFQMSIKKLLELAPGNLIELGLHPENGVDLVYNGKCIARGELLRIGDRLGVRIIEKR